MATSVQPSTALAFLDDEHDIYKEQKAAWERDEDRMTGGDAVIPELTQFDGESVDAFTARKKKASPVNFVRAHVSAVTGELSRKRPMPGKGFSFGHLGDIRARAVIDTPTMGELLWYNVDGVGADGSELPAFMDGVDERAQVTGHRWLMWEAPTGFDGSPIGMPQLVAGQRPYLVEYSPLSVRNWAFVRGELQFAVVRVQAEEPKVVAGAFVNPPNALGYYLLVRDGYDRLGAQFAAGGWWLYDADKNLVRSGRWNRTKGLVPMWAHYGEKSDGTAKRPAMSRSSTVELGQIMVSLMDTMSARDYDYWDACASRLLLLNAGPKEMDAVAQQVSKRSIYVGVPAADLGPDKAIPVDVYDASMGAVAAEVSESIIAAKFQEAREQSFQQITSTPDSSGRSKEAGHAENKAPLLAKRARYRQQSENTLIYFAQLRLGVASPSGASEWPTDFDLAPLVDAIDAAFDTLKRSGLKSKTASVAMAIASLEERGVINDQNRKAIEAELGTSFDDADAAAKAERALLGGGVPE